MVEVHVNVVLPPKLESLLDATGAVAKQWEDMTYCYGDTAETNQLAELLDELVTACREFLKSKQQ